MTFKAFYKLYLLNLFLIASLIANPFITYLLFQDILIVVGFLVVVTMSVYFSFKYQFHRKWILVYVLNFFALISICFHFEVVFKYAFTDYIIEDLYTIEDEFYFNKPNLNKYLEDKEYKALYRTNKQGFRIDEITNSDKTINKCDWLFLGDSYTQGAQVNFQELYTSILYRNFPDKIIVNAGVSGFGLPEIYHYYRKEGIKLNPETVFIQICNFNDFMNVDEKQIFPVDYVMHYSDLARFLLYNLRYQPPGELPLGRWTEPFYGSVSQNIDYNIFYTETSDKKKSDLKNFKKYLGMLNNEVIKNGAELVVFQIPTKEQIYYKFFEEVISGFNIDIRKLDMSYPNKFLKSLTDSLNIKYLDLQDGYNQSEHQVFFDYDEHLSVSGHSVTAQILTNFITNIYGNSAFKMESSGFYSERYPSISSDSQYIYFQSLRHNNFEIFRTSDYFKNLERLTVNNIDESHPTISKDNSKMAFTEGDQSLNNTEVVLLDMKSGVRTTLTSGENEYGAIPTFNADGSKVTFARWFYIPHKKIYSNPEIVIMDLTDKHLDVIVDDQFENWRPVFSPDDNSIVFISKRDGDFDLFLSDLKTKTISKLFDTSVDEWDPQFSPKGDKIVYASQNGDNWDLYEYDLQKKVHYQLTSTNGSDWDPYYINDTKIIFAGEYGFFSGIYSLNIKTKQ